MAKTLVNKFKIGKSKGEKLDLVTAVNGKDYETKFNDIYSGIQKDREDYEKLLNRYSKGEILNEEKKKYGFGKGTKRALATLTAIAGLTFASCGGGIGDPNDYKEPPVDNPDDGNGDDGTVEPIPDTDYVDISGRLQDCETNSNQTGYIIVKNKADSSVIGTYPTDGSTTDRNFGFTLPKKVSELPQGIILEARLGTEGNETSYKRTIELPAGDHNPITDARGNPAIRCVPYSDINGDGIIDDATFKEHMGRVNFWSTTERGSAGLDELEVVNGNSSHGLKKWNLGELVDTEEHPIFQGIEISSDDFKDETEYKAIVYSIRNSGHPRAKTMKIQPGITNYGIDGWIFIKRGSSGALLVDQTGHDGYLEKVIVEINPLIIYGEDSDPGLTNHEATHHGIMASIGHSNGDGIGELFSSIAAYSSPDITNGYPDQLQPVDIKANYIIDESTYLGMEKLDDILGL